MKRPKASFTTEVHLGLLVIIFILLLLNVVSNYTIFQDRTTKRDRVASMLNQAAVVISQTVKQDIGTSLDSRNDREFKLAFKLSSIILIPSRPAADDPASRRSWFASIIGSLPAGQVPDIARKLLTAEFQTLTRGENSEYFYVYPVPTSAGKKLLILSMNVPDLAYLDDASHTIFVISVVSVVVTAILYLMLYRYILSPFRRIKEQAIVAGREVSNGGDDVDSMVAEYRKIIGELKEKEADLIRLNAIISQKADSLEQFNRYLLASTTSGVIMLDPLGKIISINDTAASLLPTGPEIQKGSAINDLGVRGESFERAIETALSQIKAIPYDEHILVCESGRELQIGMSAGPVFDEERNVVGISVLLNDLTELKQLRAELETSRRLVFLGEMSAGLAHQLRNSIGAILGYATLVKKRQIQDGNNTGSIEALEAETREAELLVDKFLHFARPFSYEPRLTDLRELLLEIKEAFDIRSERENVRLECVVEDSVPAQIEVDVLLLKQAITNLVENAANAYDAEGGTITLVARASTDGCRIEVSDHGAGISPDKLEKIFTPFYSSRPSGTGLGLPLVRKIIDLHQGRLSVHSEVGKGSTFSIVLPVHIPSVVPRFIQST
ncbi:MAG TPA: ATP-binding protein [candidate division Zixibacteria bacterium]|nr:ATP-binding protein [candidate division Zixibacteria bacterium]